ncbi:hypothetical protein AVEN_130788-1 [Araneus ventricosus]|uniref:Uncharacterized protein n=1 Tax=Araneus ventricosus TaxID=182803 RepID=A0A4Y2R8N3_ARAVE|nr:hypothetical protein AVEN_100285-1 [Araneus ventricosus]GBN72122.1 hypothetical protein AVEN_130788-1 [Araneus ventricosus]
MAPRAIFKPLCNRNPGWPVVKATVKAKNRTTAQLHSKQVRKSCAEKLDKTKIEQRSNGLSFHEFRPRFALFPVVGAGRIDVARGPVSSSVVSRVLVVNSSRIKEPASVHSSAAETFAKPRAVRTA